MTAEKLAIAELPAWYPPWARELAEMYFSGTTALFILHGNVHDLIRCPVGDQEGYCNLPEFLATQVFGSWDIVLQYDLARGLLSVAHHVIGPLDRGPRFACPRQVRPDASYAERLVAWTGRGAADLTEPLQCNHAEPESRGGVAP